MIALESLAGTSSTVTAHRQFRGECQTDDATSELIHNHQHPMRSQPRRFTSKQVGAAQTVLRLTEKGEAKTDHQIRILAGNVLQDPPYHVLVDAHAESQSDLLGNSRTTPARVTSFDSNDGSNQFSGRSLRTRPTSALRRKQR